MADDPTNPPTPPADPAPPAPTPPADPPADPELGDAGKRALAAERAARATAEREKKALEAELAQLRGAQMTEQEKAVDAAKKAGHAEAMTAANRRILAAEVKVAATGKLANPELALKLLPIDTFTVTDDGTVDTSAITSAIDALIAAEPYLAATTATKPPSGGQGDGGPRGAPTAGQLTRADLDRLRREGRTDEITKAYREGRLSQLQNAG